MPTTEPGSAAERYAARVEAVLAQRTRLRGPEPDGDLFGGLPANHPLLLSNARRPLDPNLEIIASYIEPDDVIVDVGGGAGRYSLPLALRCREVVDVDASAGMGEGFAANAGRAGIRNARFVQATWPMTDPPAGSVALVTHATYLTRDIVPFIEALERARTRRVIISVNAPPPPARNRTIYALLYGEAEEIVPGHAELVPVLWELGILPDVRALPLSAAPLPAVSGHEEAIAAAMTRFRADQWALWPLGLGMVGRLHSIFETRFDELFAETEAGFVPRWQTPEREILIIWRPGEDRLQQ